VRAGADVEHHSIDVTDFDRLVPLLEAIVDSRGAVRVLINNAGADPRTRITEMSWLEWDALFKLNVGHAFVTCRTLLPAMVSAGGGSIIMVGSINVWLGNADLTCYTATKAALGGMVGSLAREVGRQNVRVNAIAPGWIMTERQLREHATPEVRQQFIETHQSLPLELSADDVTGAFLFLASDQSRAITRQTIYVDGGVSGR
jgi:NAD(P)-dependent dehydrogenase (short-subunit alcohol dehydrogenase family)